MYMLAAPDSLMNLKVDKTIAIHQMYITKKTLEALERHFVIDVASFMRVLIDRASPFLDAVHVVIDTVVIDSPVPK